MNKELKNIRHLLSGSSHIFWDFDGTIKDSVEIKNSAFEQLFCSYGDEVINRIRQDHEINSGNSRFLKIPLYLTFAGEIPSEKRIKELSIKFSKLVFEAVVNSPWVPGVREFLLNNFLEKRFYLITATPQKEIEKILSALDLLGCFREIYGAPTRKKDAISTVLSKCKISTASMLVIGDTVTDLRAAEENNILFVLRRTAQNRSLQLCYTGPVFDNLTYE